MNDYKADIRVLTDGEKMLAYAYKDVIKPFSVVLCEGNGRIVVGEKSENSIPLLEEIEKRDYIDANLRSLKENLPIFYQFDMDNNVLVSDGVLSIASKELMDEVSRFFRGENFYVVKYNDGYLYVSKDVHREIFLSNLVELSKKSGEEIEVFEFDAENESLIKVGAGAKEAEPYRER